MGKFFGYFIRKGFIGILIYWFCFLFFVIYLPLHYTILPTNFVEGLSIFQDKIPSFIILILSFIVTGLETFFYGIILVGSARNSDSKAKGTLTFYQLGIGTCMISTGTCVYAATQILGNNNFTEAVHLAENYSIYIFLLLFFVDFFTLISNELQVSYSKKNNETVKVNELRRESRFILSQMFLIEFAVLAGIIFIKYYSATMTSPTATVFPYSSCEGVAKMFTCPTDYSKENFIVGAIAMHIFFSQLIFVLLNTEKDVSDYRNEK
jgi:hypothetical protein